ncbi:MAG: sugar phosphate nucleotidyltransferase [Planctomycetota bacterium]
MLVPLILAGGAGTRFWPASRRNLPKQFLSLITGATLIGATYERILCIAPAAHIHVAVSAGLVPLLRETLPGLAEENILVEPAARDTGPCIGLATLRLAQKYEGTEITVAVFPSDHVIRDQDGFATVLRAAAAAAAGRDLICQIGIRPTAAATGYGYIHRGMLLETVEGVPVYTVQEFREKPGPDTAEEYVASGEYYWNGGMFVFRPSTMRYAMNRHLPRMYAVLQEIVAGRVDINDAYPRLERQSIDFGIMEKSDRTCVAEAGFDWDDVGAWDAVAKHLPADVRGNISQGAFAGIDCKDCMVINQGGRMVAGVGLDGLIIIASDDAVLVVPRDRAQDVKKIVDRLKKDGREDLL